MRALREQIKTEFPDVWSRFVRRREYIGEVLGITMGPDVLPMSDILRILPAVLDQ